MSAESAVVRNYIDWMLSLPWDEYKEELSDIEESESILDSDHYGLEKVKERIVEYLAVQHRTNKITGPILCLVGPPGAGKSTVLRRHAAARDPADVVFVDLPDVGSAFDKGESFGSVESVKAASIVAADMAAVEDLAAPTFGSIAGRIRVRAPCSASSARHVQDDQKWF